jgi:hypothetical protein
MIIGAFTVAFGTAAVILFEHGENNRLRLAVEPLTLILAVAAVAACTRRAKARRESRAAPILAEREQHLGGHIKRVDCSRPGMGEPEPRVPAWDPEGL